MRYALIDNGNVSNTIELNQRNEADFPNAIQSDVAAIGDEYRDGHFYRDGELVKTQAELYVEAVQGKQELETAIPALLFKTVTFAAGDVGKDREIASAIADVAALLPVRDWEKGMHTEPGEIVYDPQKSYEYLYAGKDPMTHSNQTFYPGASGVYYWAIIPKIHEGIKVYPDVSGIIVAVKQNEIWWNTGKTKKYRWTAVDNNDCNWYPGQSGVHQWAAE